jgi:hypothetical protein
MPLLEWGVASLPLLGRSESGDRYVVRFFPDGVLLAAIDGLGHGDEAALAARTAEAVLQDQPHEPVISLVWRCHERLRSTRGVVMSMASFDVSQGLLTWLGVGNVRGLLLRSGLTSSFPSEELLLRAGFIGGQVPHLEASVIPVYSGNTLILATDGISGEFTQEYKPSETPQRVAESILSRYAKGNDDALVLVARFVGNRQ